MKPPRVYTRGLLPFFGGIRRSTLLAYSAEAAASAAKADKKLTTEDLSRKLAPAEKGGGPAMIDNYCDCEVPES